MFGGLFGPGEFGTSEDCLTLNVWTPGTDGARRPVMVFVHGGAFRIGSGTAATYDGTRLVARGDVVLVTLNYRLGVLGFLYCPDLGAVNLGLQDQVAALTWVAEEIEAFGGDPDNVTIFGESAGAKSIECLLGAPRARGLFHRAILQSTYDPPLDVQTAEETTRSLLSAARISRPSQLRELPLDSLLSALEVVQAAGPPDLLGGGGLRPVIDGEFLPLAPIRGAEQGLLAPLPLVIGTNGDEARLFGAALGTMGLGPDDILRRVRALVDDDSPGAAEAALDLYRQAREARSQSSTLLDLMLAVQTDRMFRQHSIRVASAHAASGHPVWMYLFTQPSPVADGLLGSCHALELPFVFGTLDGPTAGMTGTEDPLWELSQGMQDAWLSFARSGVPGRLGAATGEWPRYNVTNRWTAVFGPESSVVADPEPEERRYWERRVG